jgi:hypothetical protein
MYQYAGNRNLFPGYNNQVVRFPFVRKERERIFLLIFPKELPATELH